MKRTLSLFVGLVLALALIGCTGITTAATTVATTTAAETTDTTASTTEVEDAVVLGNYVGSHQVSAMGTEITYHYYLKFSDSGEYVFHSIYDMEGTLYWYDEEGTYSVEGTTLSMTPDGGEVATGTVSSEGTIEAPVKASEMGSRALRSLAPTDLEFDRNYVGSHVVSAMGSEVTYYYYLVFDLVGTYSFHCAFEMSGEVYTYDETGTYTTTAAVVSMTPDGGEAADGTIGTDGTIEVPVKASSMGSRALRTMSFSVLQYDVAYVGTHTVSAMGSEVVYVYEMTFDVLGNYAFHSSFTMSEEEYTYDEVGTYTVANLVLTTTPDGAEASVGSINADASITVAVKASSMATRSDRTLAIPEPVPAE
jgi:hypothetical protein